MSLVEVSDGGIVDSESTVPIITVTNVTASRAIDGTLYTNTTGRTLIIIVTVECVSTVNNDAATVLLVVNEITHSVIGLDKGIAGLHIQCAGTIMVPPGQTYRANTSASGGGSVTLTRWIESY